MDNATLCQQPNLANELSSYVIKVNVASLDQRDRLRKSCSET